MEALKMDSIRFQGLVDVGGPLNTPISKCERSEAPGLDHPPGSNGL